MPHTKKSIAVVLSAVLFAAASAYAGDSPNDVKQRIGTGDPVAGKEKAAVCQGCHGEDGNSAAPNFPKLAGQYAGYLNRQMRDFQNTLRNDPMMSGMAATVTERQDLFDISAYFASQKQMKGSGGSNEAGKKLYIDGNVSSLIYGCINCHGKDGKGESPGNSMFPVIGGQHKDYLVKQLADFKKGERKNDPSGMMTNIAKQMTDAEIEAVSDYLSGL
ncbi:MAG: cytochrome c4 [Gallionella sp.]|nr:MAG: cytochrome c4 [Gallionella sp.]